MIDKRSHRTGNPDIVHTGGPNTCQCNKGIPDYIRKIEETEKPLSAEEMLDYIEKHLKSSEIIPFITKFHERFGQ